MTCASCGNELIEGAKFCPSCGAKVTDHGRHCPRCQAETEPGDKFCRSCGADLRKTVQERGKEQKGQGPVVRAPSPLSADRAWKWAVAILLPTAAIVIMAVAWFSKEEGQTSPGGGEEERGAMGQTGTPPGDAGGMEMMNQVQKEIDALKETLKQNPNHRGALLRLANLYQDAGMYPQAIDYYTKFLVVDSTNVDARVDLGTCYFNVGQHREAIMQGEIALKQNPTHRNALYNLGVIHASAGNIEEARRYWNRVIELHPDSETAAHAKENLKRLTP